MLCVRSDVPAEVLVLSSPLLVFGSLLASAWAAVFHLLFGKRLLELIITWVVGVLGFALGQAMAMALGFHFLMLGPIHCIEATAACWIAMFIVRWLKV